MEMSEDAPPRFAEESAPLYTEDLDISNTGEFSKQCGETTDSVGNTEQFEKPNGTVGGEPGKVENRNVVFNLDTNDAERKTPEPSKENYVAEFHKFLQEENKAHNADKETLDETKSSNVNQHPEESSDSSWYKIGNEKQTKHGAITVGLDESSNLSMPENESYMSSNRDSYASFHEQNSNMDEGSNLSMPGTPKYAGHQPVFDESANLNPPSNSTFARPDTPNSDKDKNGSESTPAKKYRRGTLQIAADDASEHGQ